MGSQIGKLQYNVIAPFAFHAPSVSTYKHNEKDLTFIHTIKGDRIYTSLTTYMGDSKRYWEPGRYGDDTRKFIILSHGNANDIGQCRAYCKYLADTFDANVITYDYVNYGCSERGETTQENMQDAILAVYEHINRDFGVPQHRIVLMGKSLGTAPTVFLSSRDFMDDVFGVVLISPLASGVRAIAPRSLVKSHMLEYFDRVFCPSIEFVKNVRVPVFAVHGKQDEVIPVQNTELLVAHLHRKAYYPPLYVHGGHNDIETGNAVLFRDQMIAFFKSCEARRLVDSDARMLYD
jgi:pimeloyl-ACP methyl ester carboxylesterase